MSQVVSLWVGIATAQQTTISLTAKLTNPRFTLGEVGALELQATGGEPEPIPRSINVPGLNVTYTGRQFHQDRKVVNGQVVSTLTHTYYYTIKGSRVGEYTIPRLEAKIRGQSVSTQPIRVLIERPKTKTITPIGSKFAKLDIPEEDIYVNQIFPVDATIYVAGRNAIHGVNGADLKHESFVIRRFEQVNLGAIDLSDDVYSTAKLPTTLFALKAGDHRVGPATFNVKLYEKGRYAGANFFPNLKVRTVESETIRINVLPLPSGAPMSFSSGVGKFELESGASPLHLKIGDPISLNFTVTGSGNFQTLGAPVVNGLDTKTWKTYEAKKDLRTESDGVTLGRCNFTQIMIPLQQVDQIPSFEMSFFDPEIAKYVTRQTMPISIKVAPDEGSVANQPGTPVLPSNQAFSTNAASIPVAQFPDILHIRKNMPKWRAYSPKGRPAILLGITNGLLSLAFFGLLGLGIARKLKERRNSLESKPNVLTFKESLHQTKPGMDREDFYHSALEAFSLWQTENPNASSDVHSIVETLKSKCETALYSEIGDTSTKPISTVEANEFLKVLKKLPTH